MATQASSASTQYLVFRVEREQYCVLLLRVFQIQRWSGATRVPNAPPDVVGIVKIDGNVVPIVDLRRRFGLPVVAVDDSHIVLLLEVEHTSSTRLVGVLIDEVLRDATFADASAAPPAQWSNSVAAEYIQSVITTQSEELLVLDTTKLLRDALSFAGA